MTTILILGGCGFTDKLLVKHLLTQTDVQLTIAARNLDKAQRFVDLLSATSSHTWMGFSPASRPAHDGIYCRTNPLLLRHESMGVRIIEEVL